MDEIKKCKICERLKNNEVYKVQGSWVDDIFELNEELEEKDKEIDKLKKHNKKEFSRLNRQLQNKDKIIDLMAEQLTTLIHSKEWVKEYYKRRTKKI